MLGSGTKVAQAVLRAELRKNARLRLPFIPARRLSSDFPTFDTNPVAFDSITSPHPADTSEDPLRTRHPPSPLQTTELPP